MTKLYLSIKKRERGEAITCALAVYVMQKDALFGGNLNLKSIGQCESQLNLWIIV